MMQDLIKLEKKLDLQCIGKALRILVRGGTLIYPTDTVYGLGCDATNDEAVEKIFAIKGRERKRPLSVMVDKFETISNWMDRDSEIVRTLREKFLPGPLTLVIEIKNAIHPLLTGNSNKLGIRIPNHYFCNELCRRFGKPIVTTSANPSGKGAFKKIDEIDGWIKNQVDLIVDGGEIKSGGESTVLDLTEVPPLILREGVIKKEELSKVVSSIR